jgi:hypothetical protein
VILTTVTIRAPRLAENTNRTQNTEKNYADVASCKFFARHQNQFDVPDPLEHGSAQSSWLLGYKFETKREAVPSRSISLSEGHLLVGLRVNVPDPGVNEVSLGPGGCCSMAPSAYPLANASAPFSPRFEMLSCWHRKAPPQFYYRSKNHWNRKS